MELYAVIEIGKHDERVIALFDSIERAEKAADWLNENTGYIMTFFEVRNEPFVLNKISKKESEGHGLEEYSEMN